MRLRFRLNQNGRGLLIERGREIGTEDECVDASVLCHLDLLIWLFVLCSGSRDWAKSKSRILSALIMAIAGERLLSTLRMDSG
jgi:hypothetical protein